MGIFRAVRSLRPLLLLSLSLTLSACVESDLCARAPGCEDNRALNCDYTCAGCTGTPDLKECGASATCQVAPGDPTSILFHRDRAVCVVAETEQCNPSASPAPTCSNGVIRGCSEYRRVIEASCARADKYFLDTSCCTTPGGGADAGVDGGP